MAYVDPNTVISPRALWVLKGIIHNTGQGGWSVAEGEWDGTPCLAIRWNGSNNDNGVGNPQSRGHATWFIVPDELQFAVRREISLLGQAAIVSCDISRPDGYDFGAWRVEVKLPPHAFERLGISPLVFSLPTLPNRMCHPEKGYARAVGGELRGCFVDGKWLGDVYSNGIHEDDNPIKIDAVRDAFIQSTIRAIQQAGLIG